MTATARQQAIQIRPAADMYGVSPDVIRQAIYSGELKAKKVGTRWLIRMADLVAWFDNLPDA